jgi:hypothetical protein
MTKNLSKPMFLLISALLFSTVLEAQSVHFSYTNGTGAAYNLQDVRKITFTADVMNLHLQDGTISSWNVSTIGYYDYNASLVNVEPILDEVNNWNLQLFPNPTKDEIQLKYNLSKEDKINISLYDLTGKLVLEKNAGSKNAGENQDNLDLRQLAAGNYICRISGERNSISKQIIKQ